MHDQPNIRHDVAVLWQIGVHGGVRVLMGSIPAEARNGRNLPAWDVHIIGGELSTSPTDEMFVTLAQLLRDLCAGNQESNEQAIARNAGMHTE